MPAARGVKRTASKTSASTASTAPKNKKKRGVVQLEIPAAPKKRGSVLASGQGDVGQLGLGEDVVETTKFKYVSALGDKIVDVCAGGMHTIALDSDGKVWSYGCNDEGALGRNTSEEESEGKPGRVTLPGRAVAVAAGDSHSAALLHNGDVYAWGSFRDSHGSMGLVMRGREGKSCKEPVKVDIGEPAAGIASGGDHLVILSVSGAVYTMGCGEQGQLGRLSQRSASRDARQGFSALLVPSKVTLKAGASRIWAGYHATFVLDASGEKMFAWGLNNYGQLGITGEKRKTAHFAPMECDAFSVSNGWKMVACGQHHTVALDINGQVYCVGRCEYGRLGLGERTGDAESLEPVTKLQNKKCISIAAGTSNSFAVTETGEIFSWGMGSEGQLGTGSSSDATEPTAAVLHTLAERSSIRVSAGGQHTVILVEDPNSPREPSPEPEEETEEEKVEDAPEVEVEKPRPTKRQKKIEQDEEITSTSAQANKEDVDIDDKKVNGAKKIEIPMEIDETDNAKEDKSDIKMDDKVKDQTTPTTEDIKMDTDTKVDTNTKLDSDTKLASDPKLDSDTSSQDTNDSEMKEIKVNDVLNDNPVKEKPEINGTPEIETKIVDGATENAVTA